MDKTSMLEAIISYYTEGNKAKFACLLGVSPQTISAWGTRNTFDSELIYTKCIGISADWLLTGEGSMLRSDQTQSSSSQNIEVVSNSGTPSINDSFIYKMYKEKDEENRVLIRENGRLEERIHVLESKLQECQSALELNIGHPKDLNSAKDASIKKHSSQSNQNAGSVIAPLKHL